MSALPPISGSAEWMVFKLIHKFVDGVVQLLSSLRLDEARNPGV